ncbi:MAG TPA: nitrilase-related carbon-nitrogen hydrolase [Pyrinomonadaceae bacterium]|nr:nitrilase-related carbon-nitrogen hydrolase [Pyrinomonadaceae bacterium]
MKTFRIALANLRFPETPEESVSLVQQAIVEAAGERAGLICFPECFVPGYRGRNRQIPSPDTAFLERAWSNVATAAGKANMAVILGMERIVDDALLITALEKSRRPPRQALQTGIETSSAYDLRLRH